VTLEEMDSKIWSKVQFFILKHMWIWKPDSRADW